MRKLDGANMLDDDPSRRYVLSKFVAMLVVSNDVTAVAHGLFMRRTLYPTAIGQLLSMFQTPLSLKDLRSAVDHDESDVDVPMVVFRELIERGYLVPEGVDEATLVRQSIARASLRTNVTQEDRFAAPTAQLPDRNETPIRERLAILGGCTNFLIRDALLAIAPSYGLRLDIGFSSPDAISIPELSRFEPRIVVFNPFHVRAIDHIWGTFYEIDDTERKRALNQLKNDIATRLRLLLDHSERRLLIVQGIANPQCAPAGRQDFRLDVSMNRVVQELNAHICEILAPLANAHFVDEDRILSVEGKRMIMDDLVAMYGHNASIDALDHAEGYAIGEPGTWNDALKAPRGIYAYTMAREYLDVWRMWNGSEQIKCVITDLDNTLWNGTVGETSIRIDGVHFGIHEALGILRRRGIVLASCSRNNAADVMTKWREVRQNGIRNMLSPDDFVVHQINWQDKPDSVARILDRVGCAAQHACFIDDSKSERAAVRATHPRLLVFDDSMFRLRSFLLSDSRFENSVRTKEGELRTETTKSHIARLSAKDDASDPIAFRRSLRVRMKVARVRNFSALPRLAELSHRTNQFNTTNVRYDASTLERLVSAKSSAVFYAEVADRFGEHGIVGLCVVESRRVANVAISCRVIGLDVGPAFLGLSENLCNLPRNGDLLKRSPACRTTPRSSPSSSKSCSRI